MKARVTPASTKTHAHVHTRSQTHMLSHSCGPSWELVVFQQWSEHVRKCAYTMATHAGSTILQSVAVLQCLKGLQIKHKITYVEHYGDSMCEGCHRALKTLPLLVTVCLWIACVFPTYLWSMSVFHHHGQGGERNIKNVTVNPSREIRDAFGFSLCYEKTSMFTVSITDSSAPLSADKLQCKTT